VSPVTLHNQSGTFNPLIVHPQLKWWAYVEQVTIR